MLWGLGVMGLVVMVALAPLGLREPGARAGEGAGVPEVQEANAPCPGVHFSPELLPPPRWGAGARRCPKPKRPRRARAAGNGQGRRGERTWWAVGCCCVWAALMAWQAYFEDSTVSGLLPRASRYGGAGCGGGGGSE